jgi:SAP domain-containing ribonucleoprotein
MTARRLPPAQVCLILQCAAFIPSFLTLSAYFLTYIAPTGDDEIDWDEDDSKVAPGAATTAVAATTIAADGQGAIETPLAIPNQKQDVDPAATTDLNVTGGAAAPAAADGAVVASGEAAPVAVEAPKQDFSIGLQKTDAEKEAERRAARAKKFGIVADDEEVKRAERAKKFGGGAADVDVSGLDGALPERKKRVREGREGKEVGREAKRQTPDRRAEPVKREARPAVPKQEQKKVYKSVMDDPVEKAKAEARRQKFASSAAPAST